MGQRVTMKDATGEVQYSYDAAGNATKVIHHNGKTVTYEYDKFGRLSKLTYPDGSVTSYEYDLNDQLIKVTGHDGGVTTYTYDANGNVTSCTRSNNTRTDYTYNERGDLVLLKNVRTNIKDVLLSSYAYEYDANGYIVKETEKVDSYTYIRDYTYDAAGQLVAYVEETIHLTDASKYAKIKYSYTYDGAGNRTGMVYYDKTYTKYWTDYVYDANNELISETANKYGLLGKVKSETTNYTYDVDGNLVKKSTGKLSSNVWTYYYTAENRLEAVKKGSTLLMAATYDGDNNRIFDITKTSASGNADVDTDIKSAYIAENGLILSWKCIDPACHKHLDHENCQILHPKEDEENEDFVKSVLDDTIVVAGEELLPVKKTSSTYIGYDLTYYLNDVTIDNAEVLVEYDSDGLAKGTYQYGLDRLSVEYGNTMSQYFLYNGTGSVVQTSEENGSLALRYTYDPFGTPSVRSPILVDLADTPSYTYNGESYNYTTGMQYLRARYYSTSTGSFISQDTYLGDTLNSVTLNRYTYANNNPVMYDDPSGNSVDIKKVYDTLVEIGIEVSKEQMQKKQEDISNKLESAETRLSKKLLEANINLYVSNCEKGIEFDANLLLLTDFYDPEKGYYNFDNFAQIEAAYEYLAVKTLQNKLYDGPDFVLSSINYISLNMPDIIEEFQLGFSIQFGYAADKYGNISFFVTGAEGEYFGDGGFSAGGAISISNAPTSDKISGQGSSIGGSVSIPTGGPAISVGAEITSAYDEENQKTYEGFSISVGAAPPSPGGEIHRSESNTWVVKTINIFDKYDNFYRERMRR